MTGATLERYADALMTTFGVPRLVLARGEGCYVWDEDGTRYLDLLGGIAVNALGHGHPALVAAVTEQLQTLGHVSNFFTTLPQVQLAERLLATTGRAGRVFLTNSGTDPRIPLMGDLGAWNFAVGFGVMMLGLVMAVRWR